jgi:uncharacterized protein (TIGR03118 family)
MNGLSSDARAMLQLAVLAVGLALGTAVAAEPGNYVVHNLVSNQPGVADNTDPNLKNAWGIVFGTTNPVWVADNATGVSTVYNGDGTPFLAGNPPQPLVVTIPGGAPTGIAFNPSASDFLISGPGTAARFLWATENGSIAAWNGGPAAVIMPTATSPNAVYKGLAIAGNGGTNFRLYAADFHNGKIDVFDTNFMPATASGGFIDQKIPAGFSPFNIVNIQGMLYVAYAKKEQDGDDEVAGAGLGFVDAFDAEGNLVERVAAGGKLNAPWGMALAPAGFGKFSHMLLVGNFGDGTISAFDLRNGTFAGQLRTGNGQVLQIDGLWGIAFGNGFRAQFTDTLFFAAGPNDESNGLYGMIESAP